MPPRSYSSITSTNRNDSTLTSRWVSWAPTMSNMRWSEYSPWELSTASSGHGSKPPSLLDKRELVQEAETFLLATSPLAAATPGQPGLPVRALWSRGPAVALLWLESSWLAWMWGRACWTEEFWASWGGITALGSCGCCDVISGPDDDKGCLNPCNSCCLRLLQLMSYVQRVGEHISFLFETNNTSLCGPCAAGLSRQWVFETHSRWSDSDYCWWPVATAVTKICPHIELYDLKPQLN